MNKFKKNFLDIVTDSTDKFADNGAAALLIELVRQRSDNCRVSFAETTEYFSTKPNYGRNGEAGGVNVDYQTGVSYVDSNLESTWMTLDLLVAAALDGGGTPDWWDPDWTTGRTEI